MGSFTNKLLRASLILPQGNFPGTSSNTLVLEGYRMSARLTGAGNYTNQCELSIYGMKQADMNAVTVLWGQGGNPQNINAKAILVLESNDGSGYLQVFEGQFFDAQPDYKSLPDVNLHVTCMTGYGAQILPVQPSSFSGAVDVAGLAEQLAGQMGFAFEDNGVTGQLHTPYYAGTLMDQFRELARDANFDYYFDAKGTLIICPSNQPRQSQNAVVLSPTSGLIGYVTLTRYGGVELDCLFSPAISLGSAVQVQGSQVPGTNGLWFPFKFVTELESIKPSGRWFSHLSCLPSPGVAPAGGQ
jgi:hypothetical protein